MGCASPAPVRVGQGTLVWDSNELPSKWTLPVALGCVKQQLHHPRLHVPYWEGSIPFRWSHCPRLLNCMLPVMMGILHVSCVPHSFFLPIIKEGHIDTTVIQNNNQPLTILHKIVFLACHGGCLLSWEELCGYSAVLIDIYINQKLIL